MWLARAVAAAMPLWVLAACGPSPEAIERDRVLIAIDRVRDAPTGETSVRRQLLVDLDRTPATVPGVVRARDTCFSAYHSLIDGIDLQDSVRAALEKDDLSPHLAARLLEAESRIKQSEVVMPDCERAVAGLRLTGGH